jgi:8-oxo-dGTP pyrophosphatase MutT (NUDIX family)
MPPPPRAKVAAAITTPSPRNLLFTPTINPGNTVVAQDQNVPAFLSKLKTARGFLDWLEEESGEPEHGTDADVNEPPSYPKNAAGMLLLAPDGRALFLRRSGTFDHGGEWSIPAGMSEGDEMPRDTAMRETQEEIGDCGVDRDGLELLDHHVNDEGLGFTTFGGHVDAAFVPTLDNEHTGYQWSQLDQAPTPMHPGLKATLDFAQDPLTGKGEKILGSMQEHYGPERGKRVFYASANAGRISGVHDDSALPTTGRRDRTMATPARARPQHASSPFSANVDAAPGWSVKPWRAATPARTGSGNAAANTAAPTAKHSGFGEGTTGTGTGSADTGGRPGWSVKPWRAATPPLTGSDRPLGRRPLPPHIQATRRLHGSGAGRDNAVGKRFKLYDSVHDSWHDLDDAVTPVNNPPPQPLNPTRQRVGGQRPTPVMNANAGPKFQQSVKQTWPDGTVDEHKIVRPGGPPPPGPAQTVPRPASPQPAEGGWSAGQWGDGGWPNAKSAGPTPRGGVATPS